MLKKRITKLPIDIRRVTMEFILYKHELPYRWNEVFNKCMSELPRCERMKRFGKKYARYKLISGESLDNMFEKHKRIIKYDYFVKFGKGIIMFEELEYDYVV